MLFKQATTRSILAALFILLVSAACAQQSSNEYPGDTWPTSTAEAEGINQAAIDSMVMDMENGDYGLIDAFMLIRNGKVVADYRFEQNYDSVGALYDTTNYQYNYDHPDWHPFYKGTMLHSMQSVTKSVMATGFGIALDEGLIESVDTRAMSYFEDYEFASDSLKDSMTLKDLLTMRSGIEWQTEGGYTEDHTTITLENSDKWIQFILDRPMDQVPGTVYEYNDGASVLLGKVIEEATGIRTDKWVEEKIFKPIGIQDYYWKVSPEGESDTEGGLYLKTEDLARIGYLYLRNGEWKGKQIVSEDWVKKATSPIVEDAYPDNDYDVGYGYQWWVPSQENGVTKIFAGNGYGGQFVLVSPEHDIVAVFNGWNIHEPTKRSSYFALQERILPALITE